MKLKQGLRIIMLLIIGAIVGATTAFAFNMFTASSDINLLDACIQFISFNYIPIVIVEFTLLFIPAVILMIIGRKNLLKYANSNEDDINIEDKPFNYGMMLNSTFIFMLFITFGTINLDLLVNNKSAVTMAIYIAIFLFAIIASIILEVVYVRIIQKNDPRIKGDPTKFNFGKEYFNSCDEAEKEKIALASYKTFMFNKNFLIFLMILAIFYNTYSYDGFIAVILVGLANLGNVLSYYINVIKLDNKKGKIVTE